MIFKLINRDFENYCHGDRDYKPASDNEPEYLRLPVFNLNLKFNNLKVASASGY